MSGIRPGESVYLRFARTFRFLHRCVADSIIHRPDFSGEEFVRCRWERRHDFLKRTESNTVDADLMRTPGSSSTSVPPELFNRCFFPAASGALAPAWHLPVRDAQNCRCLRV